MELFALLTHDFLSENNFSEPELYEIIQILANSNFSYFSNLSKWFETYDMYIKTTDEYQNLKLLYDEYITEIANLIKSSGKLDAYDVGFFYSTLLGHGYFSETKNFEYHRFKNDHDTRRSILGARISRGAGVCRNIASNLYDVYQKLGFDSTYIGCVSGANDYKFGNNYILYTIYNTLLALINKHHFHAIVGVKDEKGSLIIDPTTFEIGMPSEKNNKIILLKDIRFGAFDDKVCIDYNDYISKVDFRKSYAEICNVKSYFDIYTNDELYEKYAKLFLLMFDNHDYFDSWQNQHMDLIKEISSLDKQLSNYIEDNFDERIRLTRR